MFTFVIGGVGETIESYSRIHEVGCIRGKRNGGAFWYGREVRLTNC